LVFFDQTAFHNKTVIKINQGGNGGFPGSPILGNPMGIPEIQWESRESDGNPGRGTHDTNKSNVTKISIFLTQNKVHFYSVNVLKSIFLKKKC
jgi:hypothetical protein